jgi:hypothetical protein
MKRQTNRQKNASADQGWPGAAFILPKTTTNLVGVLGIAKISELDAAFSGPAFVRPTMATKELRHV